MHQITAQEQDAMRQAMACLRAARKGFEPRRPQLRMIATVAHALGSADGSDEDIARGANIAVIEAGTGTGKSLGSLVPAIVMALSRQRKLVVSTSTIALQHQLFDGDLAALATQMGVDFTAALIKGRQRYLCTLRAEMAAQMASPHERAQATRAAGIKPVLCVAAAPTPAADPAAADAPPVPSVPSVSSAPTAAPAAPEKATPPSIATFAAVPVSLAAALWQQTTPADGAVTDRMRAIARTLQRSAAAAVTAQAAPAAPVPEAQPTSKPPVTPAAEAAAIKLVAHNPHGVGDAPEAEARALPQAGSLPAQAARLAALHGAGGWSGDRDELENDVADEIWSALSTDSHGCLGQGCPAASRCPLRAARQRAAGADVIVVNHDILVTALAAQAASDRPAAAAPSGSTLPAEAGEQGQAPEAPADLDFSVEPEGPAHMREAAERAAKPSAPESSGMLPPAAQCAFVVDEAHGLLSKAVERFAARCSTSGMHTQAGLALTLMTTVGKTAGARSGPSPLQDALDNAAQAARMLAQAAGEIDARLDGSTAFKRTRVRRLSQGALPEWLEPSARLALTSAQVLSAAIVAARTALVGQIRQDAHELELDAAPDAPGRSRAAAGARAKAPALELLAELGACASRVSAIAQVWGLMLEPQDAASLPMARWIECDQRAGRARDHVVCVSPISASQKLRELLWSRAAAVAMTSATLSAAGDFSQFLLDSGLQGLPGLRMLRVDSPFDYAGRAVLSVPAMRTLPNKDPAGHTREIIERLPGLVTTRGTLALFASGEQLRQVAASLPPELAEIALVQGRLPKRALLAQHRQRIDAGKRSLLMGMQSLAEGVDLPLEYCTHVIIAKLPFATPDNPVEQARHEWVASLGMDGFATLTLPEVIARMNQWVGRLLRTTSDTGRVTVLDRRIADTRWGRRIIECLPPFQLDIERAARAAQRPAPGSHAQEPDLGPQPPDEDLPGFESEREWEPDPGQFAARHAA